VKWSAKLCNILRFTISILNTFSVKNETEINHMKSETFKSKSYPNN